MSNITNFRPNHFGYGLTNHYRVLKLVVEMRDLDYIQELATCMNLEMPPASVTQRSEMEKQLTGFFHPAIAASA